MTDRLLSLAIAAAGSLAGLLIATGHVADVVAPLLIALAAAAALRLQQPDRRSKS